MTVSEIITAKLTAAFQPERLEVVDESHKHEGHSGWRSTRDWPENALETKVTWKWLSPPSRQRAVYAALAEELAGPVHALQVTARAPGE